MISCSSILLITILTQRELHRVYKNAVKRVGLKVFRFHDTRHSHASILLQKNVHPKIVSERLGHSKIGITLNIYSHAIPSLQEQAVEVFVSLPRFTEAGINSTTNPELGKAFHEVVKMFKSQKER